jgi:thioredoxin reductase (NADPH)
MKDVFDIAVIGSGPSGLTAAIYTTRGAASTILFTGNNWGGQLMLTTLIENYPGFADGIQGMDLMAAMRKQVENLGSTLINQNATEVDFSSQPFRIKSGDDWYQAKAVIIASGAETVWLGVPGEEKLIGRGISSCAPCDAPFFKDKKVAVVGGGDSACEETLTLTKFAKEVTVIHRRDEFKASKIMQSKVLNNPKVKVLWNTEVKEVVGTNKLEKLILMNNKDNTTSEFPVDGLFVAIGHSPTSKLFEGKIDLDEKGYVAKLEKDGYQTTTSVPGVFVAGDVHDHHYKQAITAAGFGSMAGLDALKYLES